MVGHHDAMAATGWIMLDWPVCSGLAVSPGVVTWCAGFQVVQWAQGFVAEVGGGA